MDIGLSGTGRMGTAMGLHLMEQKHRLNVWNRTRKKTKGTHPMRGRPPQTAPPHSSRAPT